MSRRVFQEVAVIVLLTVAFCGGLFLASRSGYLSDGEHIQGIQDRQISDMSNQLDAAALRKLLRSERKNEAVLVIDARLSGDYHAGHIPGALNFPATSDATIGNAISFLSAYPRSTHLVIYCQSDGCPYDEYVARLFFHAGYDNLSLFNGGWIEWQQTLPQAESGDSSHDAD